MRATRSPRALGLAAGRRLAVVVLDLARGHFLERDRQVVLRARLDHRRRELVERALAEVVVVRVDLARALRGHEHGGVVRVHVLEQDVDAGADHGEECTPGLASSRRTTAVSRSTASSRRSLTTTWRNSCCAPS